MTSSKHKLYKNAKEVVYAVFQKKLLNYFSLMNYRISEEEKSIKGYLVSLLVRQAMVDGKIGVGERSYLLHALKTIKLEAKDIKSIIASPLDYSIDPPLEENKRMTILYHMLFMMKANRSLDFKKEELCYNIGFELGFRHEMIRDLINVIIEHRRTEMPPMAMLDKIKPYLN